MNWSSVVDKKIDEAFRSGKERAAFFARMKDKLSNSGQQFFGMKIANAKYDSDVRHAAINKFGGHVMGNQLAKKDKSGKPIGASIKLGASLSQQRRAMRRILKDPSASKTDKRAARIVTRKINQAGRVFLRKRNRRELAPV